MTAVKYRAVIFDLFGTLIPNFSLNEHHLVLRQMADILGAPMDSFRKLWSDTFNERSTGVFRSPAENIRHVCFSLSLPVSDKAVERADRVRLEYTARSLSPRPDAVSTISSVKARGLKIGLISDCSTEVPALWHTTSLAPLFDAVIFSCVVGMKKPDMRIYHLAAEKLGTKPQLCIYIGDGSSRELTGAEQAGMHPVLLSPPADRNNPDVHQIDRDDFRSPSISSLSEVLLLLDKLE